MASEPPGTQRIQLLVRPLSRALEIASNWSFTCKIPPHQKILIFSDEVKSFFILSWILLFIYQEERQLRESAIRFLVYHASYSWDLSLYIQKFVNICRIWGEVWSCLTFGVTVHRNQPVTPMWLKNKFLHGDKGNFPIPSFNTICMFFKKS